MVEKNHDLVIPALLVVVLVLTSSMLLLFAWVIWFAEIIGSITLSLLITGVVLGGVAWATYQILLAPTLRYLKVEYQQFMAIVTLIKRGYDCAIIRFAQLLKLF